MLAIVTQSNFVITTWTKEAAEKNPKAGRIFSDSILPRSKQSEEFLDKNYSFHLMPGIKNKNQVKGVYAAIKAPAYRIYPAGGNPFKNPKEYPLENYCIPCIITQDRKVYPIMRDASYDEKWVYFYKDDYEEQKSIYKHIESNKNNPEKAKENNELQKTISSRLNDEWPTLVEI